MCIKVEFKEYKPWAGAVDTMDYLREKGVTREKLEAVLEDYFPETPEDVEVNDLLWFYPEDVYRALGIPGPDEDELEEGEDEE